MYFATNYNNLNKWNENLKELTIDVKNEKVTYYKKEYSRLINYDSYAKFVSMDNIIHFKQIKKGDIIKSYSGEEYHILDIEYLLFSREIKCFKCLVKEDNKQKIIEAIFEDYYEKIGNILKK